MVKFYDGAGLNIMFWGFIFTVLYLAFSTEYESISSYFGTDIIAFLLILVILLFSMGLAVMILPRVISRRKNKKSELKGMIIGDDFKNVFIGMVMTEGKVNLKQFCSQVGIKFEYLRLKIFELIGSGMLGGTIKKNYFIPGDDVSKDIDTLLDEFAKWEGKKMGKKVI